MSTTQEKTEVCSDSLYALYSEEIIDEDEELSETEFDDASN